ncbi:hypothetical protein [uncultured Vibrio sp.]|nr:hypothetical protein [uncultured Vibrio sp.]
MEPMEMKEVDILTVGCIPNGYKGYNKPEFTEDLMIGDKTSE